MNELLAVLNVLCLILGFAGAIHTAPNYTPEKAIELGIARWGSDDPKENLKLPPGPRVP
jgi:hypothetical protein